VNIPPDTHCSGCKRLLLSPGFNHRGGVSLTTNGVKKIERSAMGVLVATCPDCGATTPARTVALLTAQGWRG